MNRHLVAADDPLADPFVLMHVGAVHKRRARHLFGRTTRRIQCVELDSYSNVKEVALSKQRVPGRSIKGRGVPSMIALLLATCAVSVLPRIDIKAHVLVDVECRA